MRGNNSSTAGNQFEAAPRAGSPLSAYSRENDATVLVGCCKHEDEPIWFEQVAYIEALCFVFMGCVSDEEREVFVREILEVAEAFPKMPNV
jgi:hypothetical protein